MNLDTIIKYFLGFIIFALGSALAIIGIMELNIIKLIFAFACLVAAGLLLKEDV